ncbi:hypothetical protein HXX01_04600 [Candidatus Nomurabacteria bacterium]|nr:hypothetical protein [Candidatus Nomurabacteria bacterium]
MSSKIMIENSFNTGKVVGGEDKDKEVKKAESHKFTVLPDGTLSEETTPEQYQEMKEDSK